MRIPTVLLVALLAACGGAAPGSTLGQTSDALTITSTLDGLAVTISSSGPLVQGVDNTYTFTVQNLSTATIPNITIASNWADNGGTNPVTKAMSPGCGTQSGTPVGVYCGTATLAPGASVSNWVVINPQKAGPVHYNAYGLYLPGRPAPGLAHLRQRDHDGGLLRRRPDRLLRARRSRGRRRGGHRHHRAGSGHGAVDRQHRVGEPSCGAGRHQPGQQQRVGDRRVEVTRGSGGQLGRTLRAPGALRSVRSASGPSGDRSRRLAGSTMR